MRQIITTTLFFLLFGCLFSPKGLAQSCVNFIGSPVSGNPGDTIEVDFNSLNFTAISSFDLVVEWDSMQLQYLDASASILLVDNPMNTFITSLLRSDLLHVIWWTHLISPVSYPDDSEIITIRFLVTGAIGSETHVKLNTEYSSVYNVGEAQKIQSINAPVSIGNPESTIDLEACNSVLLDCVNDGILDLHLSGNAGPYTFNWIGPDGFNADSEDISSTLAGAYQVTVTDLLGKEQTADLYLDSTSTTGFSVKLDYQCLSQNKVDVTASVFLNDGPAQDYTFDWGTSTTINSYSSTLKNVSAFNTYSVTVTGENNCTDVLAPSIPNCALPADDYTCLMIKTPKVRLDGGKNCIPIQASGISAIDFLSFSIDWPGLKYFDSLVINPSFSTDLIFALDSSELVNGKLGFRSTMDFKELLPDDVLLFDLCFDPVFFTDSLSVISFAGDSPVKASASIEDTEVGFRYANGEVVRTTDFVDAFALSSGCVDIISCNPLTASIDIEPAGPWSLDYSWTGPNAFQATTKNIPEQELAPGFYEVTGVRALDNALVLSAGFEILPPNISSLGHYVDNVNCSGDTTGSIEALFSEKLYDVTYQWSNGAGDTSLIENLPVGTYNLTVTNEIACELSQEFVVNQPSAIIVDPVIACSNSGQNNGSINLRASGGIAPYLFTWADDNLINTGLRNDLPAGIYQVTLTDGFDCTLVLNDLVVPDAADLDLIPDSTQLCLGDSINLFQNFPANATLTSLVPMEGISCDPCIPPFNISPTQNTAYWVTMEEPGCTYSDSTFILIVDSCVWPGDTDLSKLVDHFDLLNIGLGHGISGPLRPNASTDWMGQVSPNWVQSTPNSNVNFKHLDTDGNGLIEDLDTFAITKNWGAMHNLTDGFDARHPDLPYAVLSAGGAPFYVAVDSLIENAMYSLPVILGVDANPLMDVYGIAFSLLYDPEVIVPGSASLSFENSWVGSSSELLNIQRADINNGQIDVAVTRRDRMGQDGFGQMGSFNITIEDDIFFTGGNANNFYAGNKEVVFEIRDVRIITHKEEEILTAPTSTTGEIITSTEGSWLERQLKISPNPAQDEFLIQSPMVNMDLLSLYNAAGEKIKEWKPRDRNLTVSCSDLAGGIYWLRIATEQGVAVERLMIIH